MTADMFRLLDAKPNLTQPSAFCKFEPWAPTTWRAGLKTRPKSRLCQIWSGAAWCFVWCVTGRSEPGEWIATSWLIALAFRKSTPI